MTLDYINDFRTDVDKSIYDQTQEEKKFFDKVLGLRCSVGDESELEPMDQRHLEDDQTVPSKLTDLPFSLMASSPGSAFMVETSDHCLDLPRAPPPSYEEHEIISKFHHQEFSDEDQAARWEDIQDIIRRESFTSRSVSSLSSSVKSENRAGLDCQIQSWSNHQLVSEVPNSNTNTGTNCSIGQTPDWYSNTVQEPVCYMPLESFLSARSSNSSPASTTGSFAPTYNSYPPSMASNPSFFDLTSTSRHTPSPSYDNNCGSNATGTSITTTTANNIINSNHNNSNCSPVNNKKQRLPKKISEESPEIICGMTFQHLMSFIPETGHIQLWQFLIKLLCDKAHNNCIRWEGDEGHFTILNQEELAKRWGERKRRKQMTYEKLSRAIRYYYDKNYVNKIHGKKATYKFNFDELLKSSSRPSHQSKAKDTDESAALAQSFDISNFHATMPVTPASSSSSSPSSMQSTSSGAVFNGKRPLNASSPYLQDLPEYSSPLQTSKKAKLPYISQQQQSYNLEQHFNQNASYLDASGLFNEDNAQSYY
ncbi:Friend leukemia integration 1 transcription factor-like [Argonauta hians]